MSFRNHSDHDEHISIGQRFIGIGILALGGVALYVCATFLGQLEGRPLYAGMGVAVVSALTMFFGVVIGFPDFLPKKIVAGTFLVLGIFSMLLGATILVWVFFNLFVERQAEFQPGRIGLPILMVTAGFGVASASWSKLRKGKKNRRGDYY